jgi:putative membrane protein
MNRNSHTRVLCLLLCLAVFGLPACQSNNDNSVHAASGLPPVNVINSADQAFIVAAQKGSIQERVLGRMAEEKSQNRRVKDFGRMIARDHNNALQTLDELMHRNDIAEPKNLPEDRSQAVQQMKGLSGEAFDKAFFNVVVEDHQKAIASFRKEAESGQNAALRYYAQNLLPMLEKHLREAQDLQNHPA